MLNHIEKKFPFAKGAIANGSHAFGSVVTTYRVQCRMTGHTGFRADIDVIPDYIKVRG